MGRMNRSRKRKDAMNRVKRERCEKRELAQLKKVLGIVDTEGDLKEQVIEFGHVKTAAQLAKEKLLKEEEECIEELNDKEDKGEIVEVINEKTKKVHRYNTKTMRDQYGTLPPWKQARRTERKMRKFNHSKKLNFNQAWCAQFVPLD